jgi:hypothetical protein
MNDKQRIDMRIDELKDWVAKRFESIEERQRSAQLRAAGALVIAIYMVLFYALARVSEVSHPDVACESEHPTTGASHP